MNGKDFCRKNTDGIPLYSCKALEHLGWIRHGFSTRNSDAGPLSLGPMTGEDQDEVEIRRRRFLAAVGLSSIRLATLVQTHSDRVQVFGDSDLDLAGRREGDALITRSSGLAIAVQVADCFPVLAVDTVNHAIAAIHSGWRGTVARILCRTLEEMSRSFGTDLSSVQVAIGPGIRNCCMQVGEEVARQFDAAFPGEKIALPQAPAEGKYLADLPRALAIQCREAGIPEDQIFDLGECTRCRPDEFFSYRAEGRGAGRMLAVIGLMDR